MRRRVLLCLTLAIASGCQGGELARPQMDPGASPARTISDGSHSNGNPNFFFLPPMVGNPNSSPNWAPDEFKADLTPNVHICALNSIGACDDNTYAFDQSAVVNGSEQQYQVNWKVPKSPVEYYRIQVYSSTTPNVLLGIADVKTEPNAAALKYVNTGDTVPLVDGSTLPIKFRIQKHALESYASGTINLSVGGTVSVGTGNDEIGVSFPAGNASITANVFVSHCDDLNPRALDLPVFGPCVRVRTDPDVGTLKYAATVFACGVNVYNIPTDDGEGSPGMLLNQSQSERITLQRLDGTGAGQTVTALQHAPACSSDIGLKEPTLKDMLAALRHGQFKSATRDLASLLGPKPAYAFFIDLGGGGFTTEFSDFQFALPASFDADQSITVFGDPGSTQTASVRVRDVGNQPVRGVHVVFRPLDGSAAPQDVTTGPDGIASTRWTLGSKTVSLLVASGRGVGGTDFNGPRDWVDPFQPIHDLFDAERADGPPIPVLTGSVTITSQVSVDTSPVVSTP